MEHAKIVEFVNRLNANDKVALVELLLKDMMFVVERKDLAIAYDCDDASVCLNGTLVQVMIGGDEGE